MKKTFLFISILGLINASLLAQVNTLDKVEITSTVDLQEDVAPPLRIGGGDGYIGIDANEIAAFMLGKWAPLYINGSHSTSNTYINGDGTGNVGIGTLRPDSTAKLHVRGKVRIEGYGDVAPGETPLFMVKGMGSKYIAIDDNEIGAFDGDDFAPIHINGSKSTSNTYINGDSSGLVGIGILAPKAKLHVKGSTILEGSASIGDQLWRHVNFAANRITAYKDLAFTELKLNGEGSTSNTLINYDGVGLVGIGTETPQEKLHVEGNAIISDTLEVKSLYGVLDISSQRVTADFVSTNDIHTNSITSKGATFNGTVYQNGAVLQNGVLETKQIKINKDASKLYSLIVNGQSKHVGDAYFYGNTAFNPNNEDGGVFIGPVYKDATIDARLYVTGNTILHGKTTIGDPYVHRLEINENAISSYFMDSNFDLEINANASTSNTLINSDGTGFVGVGTKLPKTKFHVVGDSKFEGDVFNEGTIKAHEIIIEMRNDTWPDFVFSDDYNLLDLSEVETHIIKNGHLPEVPSASQVAEDGISVGEMNRVLLQKVEELTLYMIEQQKRIEDLERIVKQ